MVGHGVLQAQKLPVLHDQEILSQVKEVASYVYNESPDSAELLIKKMELRLPKHPVIPMMRAMNIAWQDQPIRTTSPTYPAHQAQLEKVIAYSEKLIEQDPDDLDGLFFKMSAHGLLAEYLAREGSYMKSVTQAKKTYNLITVTMEQTEQSPEFYFLAGLYNYFREKYPERHPVYSPFLWFFKSGNKALGLKQLDSAVYQSTIVRAEAHLYTAYIYLRYENNPHKALFYLKKLHYEYPRNTYFKAKYIEGLMAIGDYQTAMPLVKTLLGNPKAYFRMCGEVFTAIYQEKIQGSDEMAEKYYHKAIASGNTDPDRGEYYKSLAFVGMGRIMERQGKVNQAINYYKLAVEVDESDLVTKEAKERLERLD
ncbi:hypothetical protein BFP72_14610 [Reichenbachiella sp. 5M10]|nr:hypothetical protein BFP72_14610 [Reichenbachiella sp. 5M10]